MEDRYQIIMGKLSRRVRWIYNRQWDYQFLSNLLECKADNIENIFIGSSYVLFGINDIANSVVLALPSQDIYYSMALLDKYFDVTNSIKLRRVILGLGYYTLYHDLSKAKTPDENNRILDIYYPLLNDLHNMPSKVYFDMKKRFGLINDLIRIGVNRCVFWKGKKGYFEECGHERIDKARVTWSNRQMSWCDLSEEERVQAAKIRSDAHAKLFKYENTKTENMRNLERMHFQCSQKGISFGIFLAPMSSQYMKSLSSGYRNRLPEIRAILKNNSDTFIDYNIGGGTATYDRRFCGF